MNLLYISKNCMGNYSKEKRNCEPEISYTPMRFVTMSDEVLHAGVETCSVDGFPIKVFNPPQTVVGCFKYHNKVGLDVTLEALKEGLAREMLYY